MMPAILKAYLDKAKGVMHGRSASGAAPGYATAFMALNRSEPHSDPHGTAGLPDPGLGPDRTRPRLAAAEGPVAAGGEETDAAMAAVKEAFRTWMRALEKVRVSGP